MTRLQFAFRLLVSPLVGTFIVTVITIGLAMAGLLPWVVVAPFALAFYTIAVYKVGVYAEAFRWIRDIQAANRRRAEAMQKAMMDAIERGQQQGGIVALRNPFGHGEKEITH